MRKGRGISGVVIVLILHFLIMSFILMCIGVRIKYGLEDTLISTKYFGLIDSVYEMIYFIYYGSLISFTVLFISYIFITKWRSNHKEEHNSN